MASESKRPRLEPDEVVQGLAPDPASVPNARMFVGLLGPSARDGYWRLYFSTELKDFVDVAEGDVLYAKSLRTPENPLGGTALWVRAEADLDITRRTYEDADQKFLTGSISARFLQSASAGGVYLGRLRIDGGGGIKSIPPVESCVPSLCMPDPPPPDPPGTTAVCTLATNCFL